MQILLFRHGIAEPRSADKPDSDRMLTPRGIERTITAANGLARIADCPQVILTSPKLRALQTANILAEVFNKSPQIVQELAEGSAEQILQVLKKYSEDYVLLVGHEPAMSELAILLCAQGQSPDFLELKKAGCILLESPLRRDESSGRSSLCWLMPPRVLRTLAEKP